MNYIATRLGLLWCIGIASIAVSAQSLSPQQAVELAIKNHPALAAAQNLQKIAALNNSAGAAGMLPNVLLTGTWNSASQNTNLTFNNGSEVSRKGAGSNAINGGIQMNQDVFGGFRSKALKEKLNLDESSAGEYFKAQKLLLTEQVLNAYYAVVNELQWLKQLQQMDSFYSLKLAQTELLYSNGKSTETDLLQARADLAQQKAKTLLREAALTEGQARLNLLLFRLPDTPLNLSVTELPDEFMWPDTSELALLRANPDLVKLKNDIQVAQRNKQMAEANLLPTLSAGVNINSLNTRSDVGLLLKNRTLSGSLGFNLNYPLFSGGVIRRNVDVANIGVKVAELTYQKALLETKTDLHIAIKQWRSAVEQANWQKQATVQYKRILDISQKSFELGKGNRLELVQSQTNYESALSSYMQIRFQSVQYYHALRRILAQD